MGQTKASHRRRRRTHIGPTSVLLAASVLIACPSANTEEENGIVSETALSAAYRVLTGSPSDEEITRLLADASLASLQGDVEAGDYELVPRLIELLDGEDTRLREAAAGLLGSLLTAYRRTEQPSLSDAEKASVRPRVDAAIEALAGTFDDEDASLRLAAVKAVSLVERPALIDPLIDRLQDPSALVRLEALFRLHELRDTDDTGRISAAATALLDDPDSQVRELAALIVGSSASG